MNHFHTFVSSRYRDSCGVMVGCFWLKTTYHCIVDTAIIIWITNSIDYWQYKQKSPLGARLRTIRVNDCKLSLVVLLNTGLTTQTLSPASTKFILCSLGLLSMSRLKDWWVCSHGNYLMFVCRMRNNFRPRYHECCADFPGNHSFFRPATHVPFFERQIWAPGEI